jgi:hypothetical protein
MRLEEVDCDAHARIEGGGMVEQPLEREQALGAEAGDRDAQRRLRPGASRGL